MYCPKCGGTNLPTAQFCERCGNPLTGNISATSVQQPANTIQSSQSEPQPSQIPTQGVMPPPLSAPVQPQQNTVDIASPLVRFFAFLIDVVAIGIVTIVVQIVMLPFASTIADYEIQADEGFVTFITSLLPLTLSIFAYVFVLYILLLVFPALFGATIGKMLMRIKIVDTSYKPVSYFKILLREWIGKAVSSAILYIGFISIIFDSENRGWHDRIAATLVIKRKEKISLHRQPLVPTIIFALIVVLFSFVVSIGMSALVYYGAQGNARDKELYADLERFFDNDTKIGQDIGSVSTTIVDSLNLTRGNLVELEKYEIQINKIGGRLKNITSESEYNVTILQRAKTNLDLGNTYKVEFDNFFRDMEEGQQLMIDTLKEYIDVWSQYEVPISAIFTIAGNDARLIQMEKTFREETGFDLDQIYKNAEELEEINAEIMAAKTVIKNAEQSVRMTKLLLDIVENEAGIAQVFVDLARTDQADTGTINKLIRTYQEHADFLNQNSLLGAYKAWVEIEVSPKLSQFGTKFSKASQKIDDSYGYYRRYILEETEEPQLSPQTSQTEEQ